MSCTKKKKEKRKLMGHFKISIAEKLPHKYTPFEIY